jgi:hypothetical protein
MGDACSPFRFVWDQRSRFSISLSDFSFGHLRTTARLRYVCYGCQLESGIFRQWPNEKSEMRNGKSSSAPVSSTHAP